MKRLLTLVAILLPFVSAIAQSQNHNIVIDASTLAPVQTDVLSGVAIDKIGLDTSKRPCARLMIHINRMTRAELEDLELRPVGGNIVVMKQVVNYDGNGLIVELTAKEATRFYLHHDKYGDSNEVSLNLEGDKEYKLSGQLNFTHTIIVRSNIKEAEVYLDDIYQGRINSDNTLTINDVIPGVHKLRIKSGILTSEQQINVNSGNIYFEINLDTEETKPQYVLFEITPKDATVVIDNKPHIPDSQGCIELRLYNGKYNYHVSAGTYHDESGSFEVKGKKLTKTISLKPAHGWVSVAATEHLKDANIYIDDIYIGQTPVKSGNLISGEHKIKVIKNLYLPYEETIVIEDDTTLDFHPTLSPNFATVTLTTAKDANIYVNGTYKGNTTWTGNLESGLYVFEASKDRHTPTSLHQEIKPELSGQTIYIEAPKPITGTIDITSTPTKATVKVDDVYIGETPLISDLLVGTHNIVVSKQGYKSQSTQVTVEKGEIVNLSLNMTEDREPGTISITSNQKYTEVSVNGKYIGEAPITYSTYAGNYEVEVAQRGYIPMRKEVNVVGGKHNSIYANLKPTLWSKALKNISQSWEPRIGISYGYGVAIEEFSDLNPVDFWGTPRSSFSLMTRLWMNDCLFNITTGLQLTTYEFELGQFSIPALLNIRLWETNGDSITYLGVGTDIVSNVFDEKIKGTILLQFGWMWDSAEFCLGGKIYTDGYMQGLSELELRLTLYL